METTFDIGIIRYALVTSHLLLYYCYYSEKLEMLISLTLLVVVVMYELWSYGDKL